MMFFQNLIFFDPKTPKWGLKIATLKLYWSNKLLYTWF